MPAAPTLGPKTYGVLGVPVGSLAALKAIKAAGSTHVLIQAPWDQLQPRGAGTSLNAAAVDPLTTQLDQAKRVGLRVMWENAFHYPPAWVLAAVEPFVDQNGVIYDSAGSAPGRRVANWMWTARGQLLVADFLRKLAAALGPSRCAQMDGIKTGGGWYGELHYPPSATGGDAFQGFGTSMQTGIGLAPHQVVCPLPGYRPFSGRPRLDSIWLDWYLDGLGTWLTWLIAAHRSAGFAADFHVCHPGYGVRSNQVISSAGYQQAAALGEDPARMMDVYVSDPQVWPYCTWLNTKDGFYPPQVDSDLSAWKKIYEEAVRRNKHLKLWGENTGHETTTGMDGIFRGNPRGSALSTAPYILAPPQGVYGYQGIFWLSYASLTRGGRDASLADYRRAIRSQPA
ncbi:MAG: hypothetical protein ABI083_04240 [Lapillicoccus sp.]